VTLPPRPGEAHPLTPLVDEIITSPREYPSPLFSLLLHFLLSAFPFSQTEWLALDPPNHVNEKY